MRLARSLVPTAARVSLAGGWSGRTSSYVPACEHVFTARPEISFRPFLDGIALAGVGSRAVAPSLGVPL